MIAVSAGDLSRLLLSCQSLIAVSAGDLFRLPLSPSMLATRSHVLVSSCDVSSKLARLTLPGFKNRRFQLSLIAKRSQFPLSSALLHGRLLRRSIRVQAHVRDLFLEQDLGVFEGSFSASVRNHGVLALRISPLECAVKPLLCVHVSIGLQVYLALQVL